MITDFNICAAWISILLGVLMGAGMGIFFNREDWLGGYGSWPRRMIRLGHISFFGIGLLNLAFGVTVKYLGWSRPAEICSQLLMVACALMPATCFAAAMDRRWRHMFVVPVMCVLAGILGILVGRI